MNALQIAALILLFGGAADDEHKLVSHQSDSNVAREGESSQQVLKKISWRQALGRRVYSEGILMRAGKGDPCDELLIRHTAVFVEWTGKPPESGSIGRVRGIFSEITGGRTDDKVQGHSPFRAYCITEATWELLTRVTEPYLRVVE